MSERISPQGGSSTAPQPIFATADLRGWTEDQIRAVVRDEMQLAEIRRLRRELDESRADAAVLSAVTDPALRPLPELSVWDEAIAEARAPLLAEIDRLTADNAALRTGFEQQTASIGEQVNRAVQAEREALAECQHDLQEARDDAAALRDAWKPCLAEEVKCERAALLVELNRLDGELGYKLSKSSTLAAARRMIRSRIQADHVPAPIPPVPDHDVARAESEGMVKREPTCQESLQVQPEGKPVPLAEQFVQGWSEGRTAMARELAVVIADAVAVEREACAAIVDRCHASRGGRTLPEIAVMIRGRGEMPERPVASQGGMDP